MVHPWCYLEPKEIDIIFTEWRWDIVQEWLIQIRVHSRVSDHICIPHVHNMKHKISAILRVIPNCSHNFCLMLFNAYMNKRRLSSNFKVKILMPIKWSYKFPKSYWVLNFEQLEYFWTCNPIFLNHVFLKKSKFLDPHLITYHSNIGVHIIDVLDVVTWSIGGYSNIQGCKTCFATFHMASQKFNSTYNLSPCLLP